MRKLIIMINMCFLLLITYGCTKEVKKNDRPDWIDKPEPNFVGKCESHTKGFSSQEQCAYLKGMASIARSKGVSVDAALDIVMHKTDSTTSNSDIEKTQANVKIDEKRLRVSGIIVDKWHDKISDIMYVLIEEN